MRLFISFIVFLMSTLPLAYAIDPIVLENEAVYYSDFIRNTWIEFAKQEPEEEMWDALVLFWDERGSSEFKNEYKERDGFSEFRKVRVMKLQDAEKRAKELAYGYLAISQALRKDLAPEINKSDYRTKSMVVDRYIQLFEIIAELSSIRASVPATYEEVRPVNYEHFRYPDFVGAVTSASLGAAIVLLDLPVHTFLNEWGGAVLLLFGPMLVARRIKVVKKQGEPRMELVDPGEIRPVLGEFLNTLSEDAPLALKLVENRDDAWKQLVGRLDPMNDTISTDQCRISFRKALKKAE
ncbi:MAG: hypothetical protein CL678_07450 [Bdellovibrionaceae bacterium]|nr:hypothetical protein [Pseudobdellovibrionaceae bacterium]|tara:strand:- start:789 stop:1673 length:885 start_codon:yes stop_codon:yes gene_type:complete